MTRPLRISGKKGGQCVVRAEDDRSLTSGNESSTDSCTVSSKTEIAGLGMQLGMQPELTARKRGLGGKPGRSRSQGYPSSGEGGVG